MTHDLCVVGGGIVGLSVAMHVQEALPGASIVLVEKESVVAGHQTSHNSGVIHAGVYYPPGSLKARFCRMGVTKTIAFCREHGLPVEQCGKLIVATNADELTRLAALGERARQNDLSVELIDAGELRRREPNIVGLGALFVKETGITDYGAIARTMASLLTERGAEIRLATRVVRTRESEALVEIETDQGPLRARHVVACAGLQADRLARASGLEADFQMVPFRGDYYRLDARLNDVVSHLIYPVPDPSLPFLGVHLTRMIGGYVTVGPNAALAMAREGYGRLSFKASDLAGTLSSAGFWRLIRQYRGSMAAELLSSFSRRYYLERCRKYCPDLTLDDLQPHPSGIRAQPVLRDGTQVHDFMIRETRRSTHVCNAPSPAATAAMPIGSHLALRVCRALEQAA